MNIISDVLQTNRLYKDIEKAIDQVVSERDRSFLHIMLGWIEYRDGRRHVLNPAEFKQTCMYISYQKHNKKYNDEFLRQFGIDL